MAYLLDTNICIYIIKQKPVSVLQKFNSYSPLQISLSMITVAELIHGANKSAFPEKNLAALQQFMDPFTLYSFDYEAAFVYGQIRSYLEKAGTPIGPLDTLIAAQALSLDFTLVTNNSREFNRVPGLRIDNWV